MHGIGLYNDDDLSESVPEASIRMQTSSAKTQESTEPGIGLTELEDVGNGSARQAVRCRTPPSRTLSNRGSISTPGNSALQRLIDGSSPVTGARAPAPCLIEQVPVLI